MEIILSKIADMIGGTVIGDGGKIITDAAPFENAKAEDITYAGSGKFLKKLQETGAGAVIVPSDFVSADANLIQVENPEVAFAHVLSLFHPPQRPLSGISSSAVLGTHFVCGKDAYIGPHAVIGNHVTIGDRASIHPCTVIDDHVVMGDDVTIFPNVTIRERCRIGSRVIINAGTVIGSDGFRFTPDGDKFIKIPQIGTVQIDDDVEIGAVNTIDRASFGKTWIQRGVKTDNLIHIGHNVIVGENTRIASLCGISGSVTVGKHVLMAGQVGVADHLTIGDNVTIGPRGKIYHDVEPGQIISWEQMPHQLWLRVNRILPRLPEMKKKISELEKKLNQIFEKLNK